MTSKRLFHFLSQTSENLEFFLAYLNTSSMPNLSSAQVNKLTKYYTDQISFFRNVAGMKTNWAWIGEGTDPLGYMFRLDKDKEDSEENTSVRSVLCITGVVAKIEFNRYKMIVHLCGKDTHLKQSNFWDAQYTGLVKAMEAVPSVNGKTYEITRTDETLVFKVNLDRDQKEPAIVLDHTDTILEGKVQDLIKEGALVVIEFVPYIWDIEDTAKGTSKTGISLTTTRIKLIKSDHIGTATLQPTKRKALDVIASPNKKPKTIIASATGTPSTANLGF